MSETRDHQEPSTAFLLDRQKRAPTALICTSQTAFSCPIRLAPVMVRKKVVALRQRQAPRECWTLRTGRLARDWYGLFGEVSSATFALRDLVVKGICLRTFLRRQAVQHHLAPLYNVGFISVLVQRKNADLEGVKANSHQGTAGMSESEQPWRAWFHHSLSM